MKSSLYLLPCLLAAAARAADGTGCQVRANFQNLSSEQTATQQKVPGVMSLMGHRGNLGPGPGGLGVPLLLTESSFGQPFSTWYPSDTWASETIAAVKSALYPDVTPATTRDGIQNGGKPFRYKWLMFSGNGLTDVTAFDATSIAGWFTAADRTVIEAQIGVLKDAVAASPLDTSLRNMLLDVYYDLAVAEMQAVKPKLAELARLRLGLTALPQGKFIIDEEIRIYEEIVAGIATAVQQYAGLLRDPWPGIDPGMFDTRPGAAGTPMGRYVFIRQQPARNSTPSQYASATGIHELPELDNNGNAVPGTARVLFNGYKDLKMLWDIIGQSLQHQTELARLRGVRQAPGDLARAREMLNTARTETGGDLQQIRNWFPELFPANYNSLGTVERNQVDLLLQQSGVLASESAIQNGRNEILGTQAFLNGSANLLGYDPGFLLLVQDPTSAGRESYDVLKDMLVGNNKPLTVAIDKLGTEVPRTGSKGLYLDFQEKVERVADDIDAAEEALADRYLAITGFEPDESPGFDPSTLNAKPGSELDGVKRTIAALDSQAALRADITTQLNELTKKAAGDAKDGTAVAALAVAEARETALLAAGNAYKATTRPLYEVKLGWAAGAAASQGAYETWTESTEVGRAIVSGGAVNVITAIAGAANTAIQSAAAAEIIKQERDIDYAAIDFTLATESVDAALVVNQARQELEALKREQIANNMSADADNSARAQAVAQRTALIAELDRIGKKRDAGVSAIRKKSYADPISYYRAEAALIDADESFRTAQRWMFYTLQALEYKWHARFATTQGSKSWDSSSVFKARNAAELNDLLTQMNNWDAIRVSQTTSSPVILTRISLLEHILARNPNRNNDDPADPGTRVEGTSPNLTAVSTLQFFRNRLDELRDAGGNLVIPLSTAIGSQLTDQIDGNFFIGATYNQDNSIAPGFWREKIQYVKVNVIADDAPASPRPYAGNLTYGGTVYFRTRVPPCADRRVLGTTLEDQAGELMVSPFRFWVSPDFSQNFVAASEQTVSIPVAYGQNTGLNPGSGTDLLSDSYRINAFSGRSIAASGWKLRINKTQSDGRQVDPSRIRDIEIIIAYKHSDRVAPVCPP